MTMARNATQGPPVDIVNVGAQERMLSLIGGTLLLLYGFIRLPLSAVIALAGGGYLLYRAATGHCYAYAAMNINTAIDYRPDRRGQRGVPREVRGDTVAEASWESFPASDPPAWTLGE